MHGNILYDLTFCDLLGIKISTPPEALHAILLGHGTHLNAFARLEKEQKEQTEKKKKDDGEEEEEEDIEEEDEEKPAEKKRKNFVLTGDLGKKF